MITLYRYHPGIGDAAEPRAECVTYAAGTTIPDDAVWIDALSPGPEERRALESALGLLLPTREEASEIEPSSRLYQEGDAIYVTVTVLAKAESAEPQTSPVTFVLIGHRLLTVRYAEPMPFKSFAQYVERNPEACAAAQVTLAGLMDALTDRVADLLELQGAALDRVGRQVFEPSAGKSARRDHSALLIALGRIADTTGKARESLSTIERALIYVSTMARREAGRNGAHRVAEAASKPTQVRLKMLVRDTESLSDYADYLSNKTNFLLNAVLGLIANDQNGIIKIISIVSVIIMPPTLIASIYGMNFRVMPELDWAFGYPLALLAMLVAGLVPYLIFKGRGWL